MTRIQHMYAVCSRCRTNAYSAPRNRRIFKASCPPNKSFPNSTSYQALSARQIKPLTSSLEQCRDSDL